MMIDVWEDVTVIIYQMSLSLLVKENFLRVDDFAITNPQILTNYFVSTQNSAILKCN